MRAVLTFHSVDGSGSVLSIAPAQLASLLDAIAASGHAVVPLREILANEARDRVALTFDDGFRSVLTEAAPLLERRGLTATVFVATKYLSGDNRWPSQPARAPVSRTLSWAELDRLQARGFQIESHSGTHPDLRQLDNDALDRELATPCQALRQRLGVESEILAYPYGALDRRVLECARRHYRYAVTTCFSKLPSAPLDPHQVPRLDSYYLRDVRVHRHFGGRRFSAYLALRGLMRRIRHHPGEVRVR